MSPLGLRILFWSRLVILLALLGLFAFSLVDSLLAERARDPRAAMPVEGGEDPGIRVLLRSADSRYHDRLRLIVLQAAVLFVPEDAAPSERSLALDPQDELVVWPNPTGGFTIDHPRSERRLQWAVERLRLMPLDQTAGGEDQLNPLGRDPRGFEASDRKAVVAVGTRRYRGSMDVLRRSAQKMLLINHLPMEAYIAGVVPAEMSASWPLEALKAQAICARSYAYTRYLLQRGSGQAYDVVDGTQDQAYHGDVVTSAEVQLAVRETAGIIMNWNSRPFAPFYHASSGGRTAAVGEVFPEARASDGRTHLDEVMPSQVDPYCKEGAQALGWVDGEKTRWKDVCQIEPSEIRKRLFDYLEDLEITNKKVGFIQELRITERHNGRVGRLQITTDEDDFVLSGQEFRALIGPGRLRSTLWTEDSPVPPAAERDTYQITTFGWGHGVGMSQVSAYIMAQRYGLSHQAILDFFYPGHVAHQQW